MESPSYNFSTAKKRSTQMESNIIFYHFPKRRLQCTKHYNLKKRMFMKIISFQGSKHSTQISFSVLSDQSKCTQFKDTLFKCDKPAFRKANNASDYQF